MGPAGRRQFGLLLELAGSRGLDTADVVFGSLDGYLRRAGLEAVERREVELPIGEWGGRVGSFMASDARALCTRMGEVLRSRSIVSAEEASELIRLSTREFEEHRTTWTIAVAYGRKPGRTLPSGG